MFDWAILILVTPRGFRRLQGPPLLPAGPRRGQIHSLPARVRRAGWQRGGARQPLRFPHLRQRHAATTGRLRMQGKRNNEQHYTSFAFLRTILKPESNLTSLVPHLCVWYYRRWRRFSRSTPPPSPTTPSQPPSPCRRLCSPRCRGFNTPAHASIQVCLTRARNNS